MKLQSLLLCALVATVAVCTVGACHQETETLPATPTHIDVRVSAARRGDINETISVTGETAALSVLRLASPIAGRVTFLSARAGDHLDAGTVAARVISLETDAAVHGFAFLDGAAQLSTAERTRAQRLQRDLGTRDIPLRAPFAAVVAERLHNPGEQVAQNDVLLDLFDPQSLYALAQVPVESASRIRAGMPAEVRTGGVTVAGHVDALAAALVPQTLTVPVRIGLATALDPPLLHAAVQVRIVVAQHRDALLIPRSALLSSNVTEQGVIMVAADHSARRRTVQLGLRTASDVEIIQGITDGELVLTDGQYSLPDDTRIKPRLASD
jgi:multidrug efflux pump subunit AcrA (membrane-fusion protein)